MMMRVGKGVACDNGDWHELTRHIDMPHSHVVHLHISMVGRKKLYDTYICINSPHNVRGWNDTFDEMICMPRLSFLSGLHLIHRLTYLFNGISKCAHASLRARSIWCLSNSSLVTLSSDCRKRMRGGGDWIIMIIRSFRNQRGMASPTMCRCALPLRITGGWYDISKSWVCNHQQSRSLTWYCHD